MAEVKMIVSSLGLYRTLCDHVSGNSDVVFSHAMAGSTHYVDIGGGFVGVLVSGPFERFTVPVVHADRLRRILQQLPEQPITLVWFGERFTIEDFVI